MNERPDPGVGQTWRFTPKYGGHGARDIVLTGRKDTRGWVATNLEECGGWLGTYRFTDPLYDVGGTLEYVSGPAEPNPAPPERTCPACEWAVGDCQCMATPPLPLHELPHPDQPRCGKQTIGVRCWMHAGHGLGCLDRMRAEIEHMAPSKMGTPVKPTPVHDPRAHLCNRMVGESGYPCDLVAPHPDTFCRVLPMWPRPAPKGMSAADLHEAMMRAWLGRK